MKKPFSMQARFRVRHPKRWWLAAQADLNITDPDERRPRWPDRQERDWAAIAVAVEAIGAELAAGRPSSRLVHDLGRKVDRLGRNLLEGLTVLNDLFRRGVGVEVVKGIAAGEHTERSLTGT